MMNTMKNISFAAVAAVVLLATPLLVSAQYTTPSNSYGTANDVTVGAVLEKVLTFILLFLGILAILMIVIAGVMYITSGGDEGRVESAKRWLIYAIVGLIVALLGYVIVVAVSNALITGSNGP